MASLTTDEITAEDVLGMLVWRLTNKSTPPRILCLSEEARKRNREMAKQTIEQVRRDEAAAAALREKGSPTAFFMERALHERG